MEAEDASVVQQGVHERLEVYIIYCIQLPRS